VGVLDSPIIDPTPPWTIYFPAVVMDYLLSVNVITKCLMLISALALVLFTCLERLAGFLRLSKPRTPTGVDSNTKLDPPREDNAPTRDPDYYYHATTVVLRVRPLLSGVLL